MNYFDLTATHIDMHENRIQNIHSTLLSIVHTFIKLSFNRLNFRQNRLVFNAARKVFLHLGVSKLSTYQKFIALEQDVNV